MTRDDIGDRFKAYEACYDLAIPRRLPVVIRVDGRAFHSLKLEKPFDQAFWRRMEFVALRLCEEIQGARFAFFQSDEVSVVLRDDMSLQTQAWVGKRLQKMVSLAAALATGAFNWLDGGVQGEPQAFDARVVVLPNADEVFNHMVWRQQDAIRNSVQMLARAHFSHNECKGKDQAELRAMTAAAGWPWEDIDERFKRGCVVQRIRVPGHTPPEAPLQKQVWRHQWVTEHQPPVFSNQRAYLQGLYDQAEPDVEPEP